MNMLMLLLVLVCNPTNYKIHMDIFIYPIICSRLALKWISECGNSICNYVEGFLLTGPSISSTSFPGHPLMLNWALS